MAYVSVNDVNSVLDIQITATVLAWNDRLNLQWTKEPPTDKDVGKIW